MTDLNIEEIGREKNLLIRSCRVKINGNTIITPTRTIGVTLTKISELQNAQRFINQKFKPFGELYVKVTESELAEFINNDDKSQKFSSKISYRLSQLKEAGTLPYILLSITDDNGIPLTKLLPPKSQKFIFDLLWGTPYNSIIATPLFGVYQHPEDYHKLIEAFQQRQKDAIDRKNQPIMAIVPPSYSLIEPKLIENYWNGGIRLFGYNCENKKYGAYAFVVESLHNELSKLSKKSKENYLLNGVNSKYKYGKAKTSRIHNLIGTGFGFDTYSPNHIPPPPFKPNGPPKRYIFNDVDYGFENVAELVVTGTEDHIVNTKALKNQSLQELNEMSYSEFTKIRDAHDMEKTILEITEFPSHVEEGNLIEYFSTKIKIQKEMSEIDAHNQKPKSDKDKKSIDKPVLSEWLK